ncbi:membrane protein [Streptomyces sp. NRRL B-3648]|nr:membrane protein [Streptomyces sp. NRRL B-3648]
MRWDPTDPAQRRARYALLSGMWAVFFALFSWPYVALLLGALALYWGSSALRAKPRRPAPDAPATPTGSAAPAAQAGRPQRTAAVSGLVTASLALVLVASTFTVQLVYRDYYTCVSDALTHQAKQSCDTLLPRELRGVLGVDDS